MLTLHNLKSSKLKSKAKRLGRGSASRGDYSGRGIKGQKARSGVTGLKRRGTKAWLLRVPKRKGFVSIHPDKANVSLADLERHFDNNAEVTPFILQRQGLIDNPKHGVKILAGGKLTKKLKVKVHAVSATAKQAIIAAGGEIELIVKSEIKKKERIEKK